MTPSDVEFLRKQGLGIVLSIAAALPVVAVGLEATRLFATARPQADDLATRLAFAVRWLLAPGCTLLAGVQVAAGRGFHRDAIDGTRTPKSHALEIALRYNQNTVEQTLLAAIAWPGLAATVPHAALAFIPAMACLFVVVGVTFWIGYLVRPVWRAFGMTLTALPTLAGVVWLLARALA